ncbi:MAG: hypothetical protein JNM84_23715 [Planctomycetes bacterium]|nr:hypothetical protein [Planctomycetota bacterium]
MAQCNESALVVSTCGISLLDRATLKADAGQPEWLNRSSSELSEEERSRLSKAQAVSRDRLTASTPEQAAAISAELKGIFALRRKYPELRLEHLLIHSDTAAGEAAAEVLQDLLIGSGMSCQKRTFSGLQATQVHPFQDATALLAKWVVSDCAAYRRSHRVIFHLTGGFKTIWGVLIPLGMMHADEIVYIFENGTELLTIPRLPLELANREFVRQHLRLFRRLDRGLEVREEEISGELSLYTYSDSGFAALGPWGILSFEQHRAELLEERIWDPCSDRVRYGPKFRASIEKLPATRIGMINERLDDLAEYVERGVYRSRLDLKQLKGQGSAPSTHEIDAWSDGDARRMFLHRDSDGWILDRLGAHL